MINELIFDAFKTDRVNWFEQKGYSVSDVLTNPYAGILCFHVHVPYGKKHFKDKIDTEVYTLDLGRSNHYGILLPHQYVKAELHIRRWDYTSKYYSVTYRNIAIYDEIPFASHDYEVRFKPYFINECAYAFEQFLLWDYHKGPSIKSIDNRNNLLTFVMDSDLEPITKYFTVTKLPCAPNLEFTFKRIDKIEHRGDPSNLRCTYKLKYVQNTIFNTTSSDINWKAEYLCKKLTDEEEDLKGNCIGSCDVEFVKDPVKLTVKYGDQTYDVIDNYESKSVRSFDLRPTGNDADPVNHPNHYEMVGPFESFDIIVESLGIDGARQFCQGNIIKYQTRYREKNGEEDLKKRHWYSRMDQMLAKCKTIKDYYKLKESDF